MAEVLGNWVVLRPGERKRLHFYSHSVIERVITDPVTGAQKTVRSLVMWVDEEDGVPVKKTFSVISEKLAGQLAPYLVNKNYVNYVFVVEKPAHKYAAPVLAEVVARSK